MNFNCDIFMIDLVPITTCFDIG